MRKEKVNSVLKAFDKAPPSPSPSRMGKQPARSDVDIMKGKSVYVGPLQSTTGPPQKRAVARVSFFHVLILLGVKDGYKSMEGNLA